MNVITLGEPLVEFYRRETGEPFDEVGDFVGPFPAGAPAIFADTVGKLGRSCGLIGTVGDDDFGKLIIKKLKNDNVDTSGIRTLGDYITGTSFVTYSEDGSRKFIFHMKHAAPGQLSDSDVEEEYLSEADFLHLSGSTLLISEECRSACYRAITLAKRNDVRISFDPNVRMELISADEIRKTCKPVLEACDIILPSLEEAELLAGARGPEKSAKKLLDMNIKTVAIKMGKEGSMLIDKGGSVHIPPFPVEEVDPTGAGDSYGGGFISALLEGKNPEEAAKFANTVGAISITKRGGMEGIPTREKMTRIKMDVDGDPIS